MAHRVLLLLTLCAFTAGRPVWSQIPTTRPADGLRSKTPDAYALTGARVVVAPGETLESATVLVRQGVIEQVGRDLDPPEGFRHIDLTGKTVYPGLIDAWSEQQIESPKAESSHWNPMVHPEARVADSYSLPEDVQARLRRQGITLRLVAPSDGIIKGVSALYRTGGPNDHDRLVASDVALHIQLTPASRGRDQYPRSPMGAVALVRQTFYDAQWYQRARQAAAASATVPELAYDASLEALQPYVRGERMVVFDAEDYQYFLRADRIAREFGLNAIIRGWGDEYQRLDAIQRTGRAILLPVAFPRPPDVSSPEAVLSVTLESLMHWDLAPENPARLARAGARFAITTQEIDDLGRWLDAVRKAVRRGLDADEALRAMTIRPAELLGVSDRFGQIAAGMSADLVVCDGDLFDDKTRIVETWVAGQRYQHDADPLPGITGTWAMKAADPVNLDWTLTISGRAGDYKGTIRRGDEETEWKRLSVQPGRLTAAFDAKVLDRQGTALMRLVLVRPTQSAEEEPSEDEQASGDSASIEQLVGTLQLPDGQSVELTGTRTEASTEPDDDDEDGEDDEDREAEAEVPEGAPSGQAEPSEAAEPADPNRPSEPDQPTDQPTDELTPPAEPEPVEGGAPDPTKPQEERTEKPAEQAPGEEASGEKDADSKDDRKTDQDEADRATAQVNYPLGAYGRTEPPEQPELLALENATIWTCAEAGRLEGATLLIGGGKILAVGRDIDVPADARRIDLQGQHISPGIIDCHSHIATDGGINEGTQAVTAEVRIGDFIDATDINIYRQMAGGVTAANILHGSANPIGGQNQVIKFRWGALPEELKFRRAPAGIKFALGENVKQSNWGDDFTTRYPQTRMGVPEIVRDAFQAAKEYRQRREAWEASHEGIPPRRDLELDTLVEILEGRRWIHCHSYRQDEIVAMLRVLEEFGIQIGTLQHILEGYKVAEVLRAHGAMASSFADWWAYKFEVYDAIPYNGALMHQNGIVVSFNSDDAELARHLNLEAAKAVKYGGVSPEEALKFVTINAARQLRIDQYVGSLQPGKDADFVVWSGPPLSNFSRCEQTWIDGRRYFDRGEARQREQQDEALRWQLVQKILESGESMRGEGEGRERERDLWPRHDEYCSLHGDDHE